MREPRRDITANEARRIARTFPSYRDFVDDALFHPDWGYYSTGTVRFGEGGDYDTFPIALSPLFGRMVAIRAFRFWRESGRPRRFEICELGAGNGQLCLDATLWVQAQAKQLPEWKRFAGSFRYRIVERSPALIERQRHTLGPLAAGVKWTRADLSGTRRPRALGPCGLVMANEVLDCLSHHKVVWRPQGPGVIFVVPSLGAGARVRRGEVELVAGIDGSRRAVPRSELGKVLANERWRPHLRFDEVALPAQMVPEVHAFLHRHYPDFFGKRRLAPYFACPRMETLIRNVGALYDRSEQLWIDYGDTWEFHLRTPERRRVFAGPPRSGASVFADPGRDDITFMVDFSVAAVAAQEAGMQVKFYGTQRELGLSTGVRFDRAARELIVATQTLSWLLSVIGVGSEREWRRGALTWSRRHGRGGSVAHDVDKSVEEFMGNCQGSFRLLVLAADRRRRSRSTA